MQGKIPLITMPEENKFEKPGLQAPWGYIRTIPMFRLAWENPVFEGMRKHHRMKPVFNWRYSFISALVVSLAGTFGLSAIGGRSITWLDIFMILVILPVGLILLFVLVGALNLVLVRIPLKIRRLLDEEDMDPLVTLPMEDLDLFRTFSLAAVNLAYDVIRQVIQFSMGLLTGSLLYILLQSLRSQVDLDDVTGALGMSLILAGILSGFVLILYVLAASAVAYNMRFPPFYAGLVAMVHTFICVMLAIVAAIIGAGMFGSMMFDSGNPLAQIFPFFMTIALPVLWLYGSVATIVNLGAEWFSNKRRPGVLGDTWETAAMLSYEEREPARDD
jgi:MFS family permease